MALTDNLISYWKLDEVSGTRIDSVVASANDLTDNNTVTQAVGKLTNAGQFTSANSEYLSRASNSLLQAGDIDFTIQAWVYGDTFISVPMLVTKDNDATNREYALFYDTSAARFAFGVYTSGGTLRQVTATAFGAASINTWYHLIAWHDAAADTVNIAVNDTTPASAATTAALQAAGAAEFRISSRQRDARYWNGRIDAVGFWKRVLTSGERTQLYNAGNGFEYPFASIYTDIGLVNSISRVSVLDQLRYTELGLAKTNNNLSGATQWNGVELGQVGINTQLFGSALALMYDVGKMVSVFDASGFDSSNVFLVMPTLLNLISNGKTRVTIYGN